MAGCDTVMKTDKTEGESLYININEFIYIYIYISINLYSEIVSRCRMKFGISDMKAPNDFG